MKERSATTGGYLGGIERAYQGEVYGERLYAGLAAAMTDATNAEKWRVLTALEVMTKAHMKAVVVRHGGKIEPDPASLQQADVDVVKYASLAWQDLMRTFSQELDPVIAEYQALEDAADDQDKPALRILTEHEVVTKEFCDSELSGDAEKSLDSVKALIHRGNARL